jgi:hydroxyethylthiazole kinase
MAAHLAIAEPLRAAVGASAAMACAAEAAAHGAAGPAGFAVALLDELWALGGGR